MLSRAAKMLKSCGWGRRENCRENWISSPINSDRWALQARIRAEMKGSNFPGKEEEREAAALLELEQYCQEHPRSPSAERRPRVMVRGSTFVALLGSTLEDGVAGLGSSVRAALRAFDVRYLNSLKPPRG